MTPGQRAVLTALSKVKRSWPVDLAVACDMEKAVARGYIQELVRKGLVRRVCPCIVTITDEGRAALNTT